MVLFPALSRPTMTTLYWRVRLNSASKLLNSMPIRASSGLEVEEHRCTTGYSNAKPSTLASSHSRIDRGKKNVI